MAQSGSDHQLWFTRRQGAVSGPYPSGLISRYLILGRLNLDDQVSQDQHTWSPISAFPDLIPPELLLPDNAEGREARLRARLREDERQTVNRREPEDGVIVGDQRRRERRSPEPPEFIQHRLQRERISQAEPLGSPPPSVPWALAGVAVVLVLGLLVLMGDGREPAVPEPDCRAAPAPGVNWSYCRKTGLDLSGVDLSGATLVSTDFMLAVLAGARLAGTDLSYADLRRSDLRQADLTRAKLVGAMLQEARLQGVRFSGADLSYADLRGTRLEGVDLTGVPLGRAVWIDGRVCAEGSVGECL